MKKQIKKMWNKLSAITVAVAMIAPLTACSSVPKGYVPEGYVPEGYLDGWIQSADNSGSTTWQKEPTHAR